jgi:hypothetical protein
MARGAHEIKAAETTMAPRLGLLPGTRWTEDMIRLIQYEQLFVIAKEGEDA